MDKRTEKDMTIYIAAASDNNYVPYFSVMLRSLLDNIQIPFIYQIYVMHRDITSSNQETVQSMVEGHKNVTISFLDVTQEMEDYNSLFISNHIKIETYYRLLLPQLLPDVSKILYLDCDTIVTSDLSELYLEDISGCFLAGTRDADSAANYNQDTEYHRYINQVLELFNPYDYIQAGVILMNLDKFRKECGTKKLLKTALNREWKFHDQDVLNYVCKGSIKFVDYSWNFVYDYDESFRRSINVIRKAPHYIMTQYLEAKECPKIIHYSWVNKPWFSPGVHLGYVFWEYARRTPYYSLLLIHMEIDLGNYVINTGF